MELKSSFPEEEIFYIMNELIDGLCKAQEQGIANRDLKLENIIWVEKEDCFKIIDFGIGCKLKPGETLMPLTEVKGITETYTAPEILKNLDKIADNSTKKKYDPFKADVYSMGIIILKLMGMKKKSIEITSKTPILL